jgi:hypothetical protein
LYHYTTKENAKSILRYRIIVPGKERIKQFEETVYLTLMSPTTNDRLLIENIFMGNYKYHDKIQCAFAIHKNHVNAYKVPPDVMNPTRDLWRCDGPIDLERVNFFMIDRTANTVHTDC